MPKRVITHHKFGFGIVVDTKKQNDTNNVLLKLQTYATLVRTEVANIPNSDGIEEPHILHFLQGALEERPIGFYFAFTTGVPKTITLLANQPYTHLILDGVLGTREEMIQRLKQLMREDGCEKTLVLHWSDTLPVNPIAVFE